MRSSAKALSPIDRAFLMARVRPSPSTVWQCNRVINFLCIGRDNDIPIYQLNKLNILIINNYSNEYFVDEVVKEVPIV